MSIWHKNIHEYFFEDMNKIIVPEIGQSAIKIIVPESCQSAYKTVIIMEQLELFVAKWRQIQHVAPSLTFTSHYHPPPIPGTLAVF